MKKLIYLLPLVLLLSNCDEDSFSQIADIELPNHTSLPALSVEINTGDTTLNTLLTRSRGIVEEQPSEDRRTELKVFKNGAEIGRYVSSVSIAGVQNFGIPVTELELATPITDEEAVYRIEGVVDGIGTAFAEARMPAIPEFEVISYEPNGAIDQDGFRQDLVLLDIKDPEGTANFYSFRVGMQRTEYSCRFVNNEETCDTVTYSEYRYLNSPNPLTTEIWDYDLLVIPDRSFDGDTYRLRLQVDNFGGSEDNLMLEVANVTEDTYRYHVSRQAAQDAGDNPFAEPVTVHNPIQDGYGYFLLSNKKSVRLEK